MIKRPVEFITQGRDKRLDIREVAFFPGGVIFYSLHFEADQVRAEIIPILVFPHRHLL